MMKLAKTAADILNLGMATFSKVSQDMNLICFMPEHEFVR
jgi:hypothetical protein